MEQFEIMKRYLLNVLKFMLDFAHHLNKKSM